jgi:hypothetical protein
MIDTVNSASTMTILVVIAIAMAAVVVVAVGAAIKKGLVAGIVTFAIGCVFVFALTQVTNVDEFGKDIKKDVEATKSKIEVELGN